MEFIKELKEILIKLNAPMHTNEVKEILDQAEKLEKIYLGWECLKTELDNSADIHFYDRDMAIYHCIADIINLMEKIERGEVNE